MTPNRRPTPLTTTSSSSSLDTSGFGYWLDEGRPLLSNSTTTSYTEQEDTQPLIVANASKFSGIVNLLNTILGTGMLAMPAAVATIGLLPGIILTLLSGLASGAGLFFLSRCADKVPGRQASFFAVSQLTWPSAAVYFDAAIVIKCFGVSISYLIIIGDLMPQVVRPLPLTIAHRLDQVLLSFSDHVKDVALLMDRRFWITIVLCGIAAPLCFMRSLDALRHTSVAAIIAVFYLCVIVIYYFVSPDLPSPPDGDIELVHFTMAIFAKLPVFVFAFTCHQNLFTIHNELKDNQRESMIKVICSAIGSAAAIYELIAVLGYLSFGKHVKGNLILEYPASLFVAGGRLALAVLVVFSYPLQVHPCRASLDKVLSASVDPPSTLKFAAMTAGILVSTYLVSITVSQLDMVLAFVGSTGSTTISFILPGLFYYKIYQDTPWRSGKGYALALAVFGVVVMCTCLTFNVINVMHS